MGFRYSVNRKAVVESNDNNGITIATTAGEVDINCSDVESLIDALELSKWYWSKR